MSEGASLQTSSIYLFEIEVCSEHYESLSCCQILVLLKLLEGRGHAP